MMTRNATPVYQSFDKAIEQPHLVRPTLSSIVIDDPRNVEYAQPWRPSILYEPGEAGLATTSLPAYIATTHVDRISEDFEFAFFPESSILDSPSTSGPPAAYLPTIKKDSAAQYYVWDHLTAHCICPGFYASHLCWVTRKKKEIKLFTKPYQSTTVEGRVAEATSRTLTTLAPRCSALRLSITGSMIVFIRGRKAKHGKVYIWDFD